jgi:hypothetical protein
MGQVVTIVLPKHKSEMIADAFNTFFLTITENLNLNQEARGDAISFLKDAFPRTFPGIKTISTTETEIKSIIHSKQKTLQVIME